MAKLACLGPFWPFWVLILGLAPGISCISERSEALIMHLEYDWVKYDWVPIQNDPVKFSKIHFFFFSESW